jgi:hypothetical protein
MSEPRRWRDSTDAPVGMRELLGSAQRSRPLDDGTFRRGAERVAKFSVAPAAAVAVGMSVWTKLAAAGILGLAAAGAVVVVEARRDPSTALASPIAAPTASPVGSPVTAPVASPIAAPVPEPAPAPSPSSVEGQVAAPNPVHTAPRGAASAPAVPVAPAALTTPWVPEEPARAKSSLTEELSLLESARAQMARSPESALARLAEHRARHPAGVLAAERDLMELDALRRTGRVQDARIRATDWLAREPNGLHAARVRAILASLD